MNRTQVAMLSPMFGSIDDARQELIEVLQEFRHLPCNEKTFRPQLEQLTVAGSKLLWSCQEQMTAEEKHLLETTLEYLDYLLNTMRAENPQHLCTSDYASLKQLVIAFFEDVWPLEKLQATKIESA